VRDFIISLIQLPTLLSHCLPFRITSTCFYSQY